MLQNQVEWVYRDHQMFDSLGFPDRTVEAISYCYGCHRLLHALENSCGPEGVLGHMRNVLLTRLGNLEVLSSTEMRATKMNVSSIVN